jgi:hypothetical protein
MENEPVEKSLLRLIHFKVRLQWLRENDLHVHEVMEEHEDMPKFSDLYQALKDAANNPKKSPANEL